MFDLTIPLEWMDSRIRVYLIGAGGTGGAVLDGLVRLDRSLRATGHPYGLHVTCFDSDTVSHANVGRQRFAPNDVGHYKSVLLIHRANMAYGLDWQAVPEDFDVSKTGWHCKIDVFLTCVDTASFRADFGLEAKNRASCTDKAPLWMDFGNGQHDGQVICGHFDGLVPNVLDLFPELSAMKEENTPSCSLAEAILSQDLMVNQMAATLGLNLLWTLLRKGRSDYNGVFFSLMPPEVKRMACLPDVWASYGYDCREKALNAET